MTMIITEESKFVDNGLYSQPFRPAAEIPLELTEFINILFTNNRVGQGTIRRDINDILNIAIETELLSFLTEKFGFIFTVDDSGITDFNSLIELERVILLDVEFVKRLLTRYRSILTTETEREMLASLQSIFEDHYNTMWRLASIIIIHILAMEKLLNG